jgi:DNA-directed RNA polymerase sigma subunit (sigma70/sigma32)
MKDEFEYTIEEISRTLNISKERCRQILLVALKKLKNPKFKNKFDNINDIISELNNAK